MVGNFGALVQKDLKRLLAYSSISHAGFALMAIAADSELGTQALLYYLVPYAANRLGRPVKWIEDRNEHFLTLVHSREQVHDVELACRRRGA